MLAMLSVMLSLIKQCLDYLVLDRRHPCECRILYFILFSVVIQFIEFFLINTVELS